MSLKRWFSEKWRKKLRSGKYVECGSEKGQDDAKCRPAKRISKKTPKTWGELTPLEERRAIADKNKANREGRQFGKVRFERLKKKIS